MAISSAAVNRFSAVRDSCCRSRSRLIRPTFAWLISTNG
jgi:hypothetical protein